MLQSDNTNFIISLTIFPSRIGIFKIIIAAYSFPAIFA